MADHREIYVADQSVLAYTGKGHVTGIVVTSSSTTAGGCQISDSLVEAGGTKIFECVVSSYHPVIIFFKDAYSPRFTDGLYVHLGADVYATIYYHTPIP